MEREGHSLNELQHAMICMRNTVYCFLVSDSVRVSVAGMRRRSVAAADAGPQDAAAEALDAPPGEETGAPAPALVAP